MEGTTITKRTDIELDSQQYSGCYISAVVLSSNKVLVCHGRSYLYGIVCTIEGTTIIKGTNTRLSTQSSSGTYMWALKLSENRAFITYAGGDFAYLHSMTMIIENLTIKIEKTWQLSNKIYTGRYVSAVCLGNEKILIAHNVDNTYYLNAMIQDVTNFVNQVNSLLDTIQGVATTSGTEGERVKVVVPNYNKEEI